MGASTITFHYDGPNPVHMLDSTVVTRIVLNETCGAVAAPRAPSDIRIDITTSNPDLEVQGPRVVAGPEGVCGVRETRGVEPEYMVTTNQGGNVIWSFSRSAAAGAVPATALGSLTVGYEIPDPASEGRAEPRAVLLPLHAAVLVLVVALRRWAYSSSPLAGSGMTG
jgi:hypothetical protein